MYYLLQFIFSAIATMGFGYYFQCPKKSIIFCGISGAIARIIFQFLNINYGEYFLGNFLGAIVIGFLGEFYARKFLMPSSIFIIPSLTVLCPGNGIYYTMYNLVTGNRAKALSNFTETIMTAGILAFGILIASASSRSLNGFKRRKNEFSKNNQKKIIKF
ncbi:MAG: threonine/serine exporter family protein [Peptoniphilaceae bacterium]|nr:threonine/serine exporter family protein [Peptoniphilaceae bacterium]MDD7383028.1 threonine/serine exporter family protein [Peptoniphilaceae bacterium]MDY3737779.1 threonine/serine exporter family protein [Peptoniphilaceae bacterium]